MLTILSQYGEPKKSIIINKENPEKKKETITECLNKIIAPNNLPTKIQNSVQTTTKQSLEDGKRQKEEEIKRIRIENLEKARKRKDCKIQDEKRENGYIHSTKITLEKNNVISTNSNNIIKPEEEDDEEIKTQIADNTPPTLKSNDPKKPYKRKTKMEKYAMWSEGSKFVSIDPPITLPETEKSRFKISFKYYDPRDQKTKKKTMCFGKQDVEYLIDHGDDQKTKAWLSRQRGYYTPFHKNFWISCLLCTERNIMKAYNRAIATLIL